ncbi:condensin complex protein MksE [Methylosarcina fibrata]|uniref:condensin complex protein MksE n=1 Tax=Methylosarcina fibrata TaxID=105972 RepID=UPI000360DB40|nr:hypothetical protein [Methylosarcina fibrata]
MNTVSPLYLHKLPHLNEIFGLLTSGKHLNRLVDHQLWTELEKEQAAYETLFGALGYVLRIDGRGFAWFHYDEASSNVSKTTRQLALLFMLIFEFQADAGHHLGRFTDWVIDDKLLSAIREKNRLLLEAEALAEEDALPQLLKSASNYGFAMSEGNGWKLLSAVYRYLDRFEELVRQDKRETADDDQYGEEMA